MPARTMTIYLAKEGKTLSDCLAKDAVLEQVETSELPGAIALVQRGAPRTPWWRSYFGIEQELWQTSTGAIVAVPIRERLFLLTFGYASYQLRDDSYDHHFGTRIVLNSIDIDKLKNTDVLDPSTDRRQRTQLPFDADITYFDLAADSSVLKSLTGKVKSDYSHFAKSVTGAASLRLTTPVSADELPTVLAALLDLYGKTDYKTVFPQLQTVVPLTDPVEIAALEDKLVQALFDTSAPVMLSVPDIVDYTDEAYVQFGGLGRSEVFEDVYIKDYREYLSQHGETASSMTVEKLATHRLKQLDSALDVKRTFSIYRSLLFDVPSEQAGFAWHLSDGAWYSVATDLLTRLTAALDPRWQECDLPDFSHDSEASYNQDAAEALGAWCLDRSNVSPAGSTQIEPCDIARLREDGRLELIHVKIGTASSTLSHAFNQGANSAVLLRDSEPQAALLRLLDTTLKRLRQSSKH